MVHGAGVWQRVVSVRAASPTTCALPRSLSALPCHNLSPLYRVWALRAASSHSHSLSLRSDVEWIKREWDGKLVIKGIMDPDDALRAVQSGANACIYTHARTNAATPVRVPPTHALKHNAIPTGACERTQGRLRISPHQPGADAVVVSNHGGRQLDGAPSSVRVLPEIVEAVKGRCEVWVDGGVRSGQDVLRARALGARGVLAGRLWLYGLGAGGRQGVLKALQIVQKELDVSMGLCGHTCIDNVDRQIVWEHSR